MDDSDDQKWAALASIWQSPADEINVAHIQRQLRRRARNANLLFALDLAQGLVQIALGLVLMQRWTWPSNLVGASLLLFGGFALALAFWTRGKDSTGPADADNAFHQSVRHAEAGIRWAISGYCVIATGVLLLLILGYAHSQPTYQSVVPLPYWLKASFAVAYLAFWLWRCTLLLRDNRRYLDGLHAIESDLFPPEANSGAHGGRR